MRRISLQPATVVAARSEIFRADERPYEVDEERAEDGGAEHEIEHGARQIRSQSSA